MKIISDKKVIAILNRISANHIICIDALKKADMKAEEFTDSVNHLTDNTINAASFLYGMKGINHVNEIISRYNK